MNIKQAINAVCVGKKVVVGQGFLYSECSLEQSTGRGETWSLDYNGRRVPLQTEHLISDDAFGLVPETFDFAEAQRRMQRGERTKSHHSGITYQVERRSYVRSFSPGLADLSYEEIVGRWEEA